MKACFNGYGYGWGSLTGAISGAASGFGIGVAGQMAINATTSTGYYWAKSSLNREEITLLGTKFSLVVGLLAGKIDDRGLTRKGCNFHGRSDQFAKRLRAKHAEQAHWKEQ